MQRRSLHTSKPIVVKPLRLGRWRCMLAKLSMLACIFLSHPALAYTVEINGAGEFADLLNEFLDIRRHRNDANVSNDELQRLAGITPKQIRDLLATQGYFAPSVRTELVTEGGQQIARFYIDTGAPTAVSSVEIRFSGAVATGPNANQQRMTRLRRQWSLHPGDIFIQSEWTEAKNNLLKGLLVRDYPAAVLKHSEARIDPAQQSATLTVEVDSGPAFTFGELQVEGLERYPHSMVDALNPIKPGDRYSQDKLNELQSRLADTGYFSSVFPAIEVNPAQPLQVPVKLVVAENPRKQLSVGLGFSTDTGPGIQLKWLDRKFLSKDFRLQSELEWNRKSQLIGSELFLPARRNGWTPSINARFERTDTAGEINDKIRTGVRFTSPNRMDERSVGVDFLADRQRLPGAELNHRQALIARYTYTRRRVDNLLSPRRGYVAGIDVGAGPKGLVNEANIVRVVAHATWINPLPQRWQTVLRGQVGQVFLADRTEVPGDLLFRTGGAQSVRGYSYNSLGVAQNGAIVGGRVTAVASAELVYRITPAWGAAIFHDAGNAADSWRNFELRHGSGVGARWRSPIGPVNLDLAYGHETGQTQLHFSVGYVF